MARSKRSGKAQTELLKEAVAYLVKTDKNLARLIETVGPCTLAVNDLQSPFEALAESIIYQQLSGKAAATIFGRIQSLFEHKAPLLPDEVAEISIELLRSAGCSQAKALALKDLAEKTLSGTVPSLEEMHTLGDEELIERLTSIRGVGRWTVEMLLIFRLGRIDILPSTDYGVRKGFALVYNSIELPAPKTLTLYGEKWRPYRTIPSWYMWRALELPAEFWTKPIKRKTAKKNVSENL